MMRDDAGSDARCLKAIELTIRFVLRNFVLLGLFLFVTFLLFGMGREEGIAVGVLIVALYFAVAYRHYGRGNKASLIIAGLAGLTAANAAAAVYSNDGDDDASPAFNPATGLMMMGGVDAMGNPYGIDMNSGQMSGDDISMFDDNSHSVNPATGLPMMDNIVDTMGNPLGIDLNHHDDYVSISDDCNSASIFDTNSTFDTSSTFDYGCSSTGTGFDD
jgi:hypothetical protein